MCCDRSAKFCNYFLENKILMFCEEHAITFTVLLPINASVTNIYKYYCYLARQFTYLFSHFFIIKFFDTFYFIP